MHAHEAAAAAGAAWVDPTELKLSGLTRLAAPAPITSTCSQLATDCKLADQGQPYCPLRTIRLSSAPERKNKTI